MDSHLILCKDGVDHRLCNRENVELPDCSASSVNGFFKRWDLLVENTGDYSLMLEEYSQKSKPLLEELLKLHPIKVQSIITVCFSKAEVEGAPMQKQRLEQPVSPLPWEMISTRSCPE